ncbi:MAG: FecR family protein [Cyclobacteriaceae bacterium]
MNDRDQIIAKYLAGECSEDEKSSLAKWTASDSRNADYLKKMQMLWESSKIDANAFNPDIDNAWSELGNKINNTSDTSPISSNSSFWPLLGKAAAVLIIAIGIGFITYKSYFSIDSTTRTEMVFESNQEQNNTQVALADGSTVWVAANSKIRFPDNFSDDVREVFLEGMAFFDVVPNAKKPFIIRTPDATTKVLGTSFNLRAYTDDGQVTLTVVSGKVSLSVPDKELEPIIVSKDEKGVLSKKTGDLSKEPNDDLNFMTWRTGRIQFQDAILEDAILQLSQHYEMDIVLNTPTPQKCLLTATFDNQSLEEVLLVIETIFDTTRENKNGTVVLTAKGC